MSKYFLNPFVRISRIPYRCGYGVHSPYAFDFITGVIYERLPYYAYADLSQLHSAWVRRLNLRPQKLCRLLFRLVNYAHPSRALLLEPSAETFAYMKAAAPSCAYDVQKMPLSSGKIGVGDDDLYDFIYLSSSCDSVLSLVHSDTILVVDNLRSQLSFWDKLKSDDRVVLTFDLYDIGIVMFCDRLNRMDYTVSF